MGEKGGVGMGNAEPSLVQVRRMLGARSVAVVGASRDPEKLGHITLASIIEGGYDGAIYPINPKVPDVLGLTAYPSLSAAPGKIDLVVVVVPAAAVASVVRDAADAGATGVLILTSGFREVGRRDLEDEVATIAKERGVRLIGPNVQGIVRVPNALCACFWPVITDPGPLAVVAQSGTVAAAVAEWAAEDGVGISSMISLGNQADLCDADMLAYLDADEHTRATALYLEGPKDGRRFLETVRSLSKPLVVLKAGRTETGRRAVASHTGSLAGDDRVFSGLCRQFGLTRARDVEELYDAVKALAMLPAPRGDRVLLLSSSGGGGALAADEAGGLGLTIPDLPPGFVDHLHDLGLTPASRFNPLDLGTVVVEPFRVATLAAEDRGVADIFVLGFGDPIAGAAETAAELRRRVGGTVIAYYMAGGATQKKEFVEMHRLGIPAFPTPERAMRAVAACVARAEWCAAHPPDAVAEGGAA
jgi:acetate---CoA ligase (ADP-forming)